MTSHRTVRAVFAALAAVALVAPLAAPLACDRGPCCSHGEVTSHAHHDGGGDATVQAAAQTAPCPAMQACGLSAQAQVLTPLREIADGPTHVDHTSPPGDVLLGRSLAPLTPPPRA